MRRRGERCRRRGGRCACPDPSPGCTTRPTARAERRAESASVRETVAPMRRPPPWREFARYPVTAGTVAVATMVSIAGWTGHDVSWLEEIGKRRVGKGRRFRWEADG